MVCLLREKNQLEEVQICSQLEIILTFSRKCLFYRIFTLPIFTLYLMIESTTFGSPAGIGAIHELIVSTQLSSCQPLVMVCVKLRL